MKFPTNTNKNVDFLMAKWHVPSKMERIYLKCRLAFQPKLIWKKRNSPVACSTSNFIKILIVQVVQGKKKHLFNHFPWLWVINLTFLHPNFSQLEHSRVLWFFTSQKTGRIWSKEKLSGTTNHQQRSRQISLAPFYDLVQIDSKIVVVLD